jgi:hypothetical protein
VLPVAPTTRIVGVIIVAKVCIRDVDLRV